MKKLKDIALALAVFVFFLLMVAMCMSTTGPRPDISEDPHEAIRIR